MLNQLDLFGGEPTPHNEKKPSHNKQLMQKPTVVEESIPASEIGKKDSENIAKESNQFSAATDAAFVNVPNDEELFSKMYYPISDVANMFNVNISLIRFWEKEFDILKPRKNRKGDRLFRPEDVKNLKLIYFLLKEKRYTIEGARSFLKKGKKVNEQFETIETLKNIKSMLLELKAGLS